MNFTIKERILLSSLFPQYSDKRTQCICEEIECKVAFSKEEIKKYEITPILNGWKWDDRFDGEIFSIEFTEIEKNILKEQSKRMDSERKITRQILSLIKKIDAL